MKHYISLPAVNMKVPIFQYILAIKLAKQNLDSEFKQGLTCWWPCTGEDIVKQFRNGIHDRINKHLGGN